MKVVKKRNETYEKLSEQEILNTCGGTGEQPRQEDIHGEATQSISRLSTGSAQRSLGLGNPIRERYMILGRIEGTSGCPSQNYIHSQAKASISALSVNTVGKRLFSV